MARLRPWRKQLVQPMESAAAVPEGRVVPDPLRQKPRPPSYVWRAGQRRRTPAVPHFSHGEAEALARAEHARRQAEQQRERALLEAELARRQVLIDAGIEPVRPPSEQTVGDFINQD